MVNFVIGIGSQRAGTTLLHRILSDCTSIFMHPVKELHYYDTLFNIRHESVLKTFSSKQLERELDRLITEKKHTYINKRYKCLIRTNRLLSSTSVNKIEYLDLYRPCISGNQTLGEVTPEYMLLPEQGIKKMQNDLGAETKIILIARYPIERLISSVKLYRVYGDHNADLTGFAQDFHELLKHEGDWLKVQKKFSDYKQSLDLYKKYFSNVLFLSYDQIFLQAEDTAQSLQDFLGVPVDLNKYNIICQNKVNNLADAGEILQVDRVFLEGIYKSEIAYLEDVFGVDGCVN